MWRRYYVVEPDQLDLPVDPAVWQGEQDRVLSPQARAFALLQGIQFGPDLDRSYHIDRSYYRAGAHPRPHIQFCWTGGNRFIRWVTASDLVALSLLQARLIDLGKPIKVVEGDWCAASGKATIYRSRPAAADKPKQENEDGETPPHP